MARTKGIGLSAVEREDIADLTAAIERFAQVLGHRRPGNVALSPLPSKPEKMATAFVYDAEGETLRPVTRVPAPPLTLLRGIDRAKATLLANSRQFASGLSANNALLWGARGMGKSTLIKSVHQELVNSPGKVPVLIEISREDIRALPKLLLKLREIEQAFIVFCDDLSFATPDQDFKALKNVLEGGLDGPAENIIFYATSNRRHLLPELAIAPEHGSARHIAETYDETISLSDRFGLWLPFKPCDEEGYLSIIDGYLQAFSICPAKDWRPAAISWAHSRGHRSGRSAWQFVQLLAGEMGKSARF